MGINPLKTVCGCACAGVKKPNGHTRKPLTLWTAFVSGPHLTPECSAGERYNNDNIVIHIIHFSNRFLGADIVAGLGNILMAATDGVDISDLVDLGPEAAVAETPSASLTTATTTSTAIGSTSATVSKTTTTPASTSGTTATSVLSKREQVGFNIYSVEPPMIARPAPQSGKRSIKKYVCWGISLHRNQRQSVAY